MDEQPTLDSPESWAAARPGSSSAASLSRGSPIDRYIVVDKIGSGGMGIVYSAYDPELDRRVAVKVMRPSGLDTKAAGKIRERTMREARGMAQLSHPNVVGIYDVGTIGDSVFLAMELIDGGSLKDWLSRARARDSDSGEIIKVFIDAGRGLAAAHKRGLVHRDFKPDNVMVTKNGRARVTDFGLVRDVALPKDSVDENPTGQDLEYLEATLIRLTQTGAFLGTPHYMAPEQFTQANADERSDQFSFCVALYEALWGEHPYPAESLRERIEVFQDAALTEVPHEPSIPNRISRAILRGLAVDPADRFSSMDALLIELTPQVERHGGRSWALGLAAVALVGGTLAYRSVVDDSESSVCQGAQSRLETVWNDERAEALQNAFARLGGQFAESAAARVTSVFDAYGSRWQSARVAACEATHKYHEQAEETMQLRMRCLERRLGDFDALISTLGQADKAVVEESVAAANKLEPIDGCADIDALSAQVPPPTDPQTRSRLEALEPGFSRLRSMFLAGRYTEGRVLAAQQLLAADSIGYRPAQARAHYWAGLFAVRNAEFETANELLERGVWLAEASGDDILTADLWIARLGNVARARKGLTEVAALERRASAAIERLRAPPRLVMELNNALGAIAHEDGRFDDAMARYKEAQGAAEKASTTRLGLAIAVSGIGSAEAAVGQLKSAREHLERALAIHEEILGPLHPQVSETLSRLGKAYGESGDAKRAVATYRRAIEIVETSLGASHPRMATLKVGLASELLAGGNAEESIPLFDDALKRMVAIHGENSKNVSRILNNRGIALRIVGRTLDSRADLLRALKILEAVGDEASIGNALANIGDSYLATEQPKKAIEIFTRSLAAMEATFGSKSIKAAYATHGLGSALLDDGQLSKARTRYEAALTIRVELGASPKSIASAKKSLAGVLVRQGNRSRGCELWAESEAAFRVVGTKRTIAAADEIGADRAKAKCL